MGPFIELFEKTHSTLINRINHKICVLCDLLSEDAIEGSEIELEDGKCVIYRASMTFNLDEPLDTISRHVIEKAVRRQISTCDDSMLPTEYSLKSIDIYAIGTDKPGVQINVAFVKATQDGKSSK